MSPATNPVASDAQLAMPKSSDLVPDRYSDAAFDDLSTVGDYLPRIQLCGATHNLVQEGKVPIGNHILMKGKAFVDLGKNVQCWVLSWRPMALLTTGDKPVSFFDPQTAEFKKVQELAAVPGKNGAMAGPQFLLYIPGQGFATYFLTSKTAKNEALNFKALIDKCALIGSKLCENKQYKWHGPTVVQSSQQFEVPNIEEYKEVLTDFKNPVDSEVQLAAAAPAGGEQQREM